MTDEKVNLAKLIAEDTRDHAAREGAAAVIVMVVTNSGEYFVAWRSRNALETLGLAEAGRMHIHRTRSERSHDDCAGQAQGP